MKSQLLASRLEYTGSQFMDDLLVLVTVIIGIAGAMMALYACYIGYLFATATDDGKRRAAKTRLLKVIASVLIIFGLVSVMSVIEVTFNNAEVARDADNKYFGGITGDSTTYKYNDTPTLNLSKTSKMVSGSFVLSVSCLERYKEGTKDTRFDISNLTFVDFTFLEPSSFPGETADGGVDYRVTVKKNKNVSRGIITIEWIYQASKFEGGKYQCPCLVRDNNYYYLTATASFKTRGGNDPASSVKLEIKLTTGIASGVEFVGMEA